MSTPQRDEIDWVPVYNTTAETIPSGALARVTGVTDGVFQLAKPNADSDTTVIVVGRHAIPADRYGRGTFDPRVIAAYDYADGTPAAGDRMGSANGSWYLNSGKAGFYVLGGAGNGLVNAVREAGSGTASPLTTKGDVWGYSTTDARIPVGSNGQVLTADSTQALGVKWATPTTPTVTTGTATSTAITTSGTWTDITNASLTVPADGNYLLNYAFVGRANASATLPANVDFRVDDAGSVVDWRRFSVHVTDQDCVFSLSASRWIYLVSGTLKLQAQSSAGSTWNNVDVYNTSGFGVTFVQIIQF